MQQQLKEGMHSVIEEQASKVITLTRKAGHESLPWGLFLRDTIFHTCPLGTTAWRDEHARGCVGMVLWKVDDTVVQHSRDANAALCGRLSVILHFHLNCIPFTSTQDEQWWGKQFFYTQVSGTGSPVAAASATEKHSGITAMGEHCASLRDLVRANLDIG